MNSEEKMAWFWVALVALLVMYAQSESSVNVV